MIANTDCDGLANYTFPDVSKKRYDIMTNLVVRTFKLSYVEHSDSTDTRQKFLLGAESVWLNWSSYEYCVYADQPQANTLAKEIAVFLLEKYGSKNYLNINGTKHYLSKKW